MIQPDRGESEISMEDVDSILKARILIDERIIKRLSKRAVIISGSYESLSDEQKREQLQLLYVEIRQFEINLAKVGKMLQVCELETEYYKGKKVEMEQTTLAEISQIEELKTKLEEEKLIMKNKQDYDAIADKICKFPARKALKEEIRILFEENTAIDGKKAEVQLMINQYRQKIAENFANLNGIIEAISEDVKSK